MNLAVFVCMIFRTVVNAVFKFLTVLITEFTIGATFTMTGLLHAFKRISENEPRFLFACFRTQNVVDTFAVPLLKTREEVTLKWLNCEG